MNTFLNGQDGYSVKYLKQKLKKHYGEDITITSIIGKSSIVSFRDSAHKILREKWKTDKVTDVISETEWIIDMATSIIHNNIWLRVYNLEEYHTMEEMENEDTLITDSLKHFIHNLVDQKGKVP